MNLLNKFWQRIRTMTEREREEQYLAESVDLVDLERRQRALQQKHINPNLHNWV